jgi:hypothetical protein
MLGKCANIGQLYGVAKHHGLEECASNYLKLHFDGVTKYLCSPLVDANEAKAVITEHKEADYYYKFIHVALHHGLDSIVNDMYGVDSSSQERLIQYLIDSDAATVRASLLKGTQHPWLADVAARLGHADIASRFIACECD